MIVNINLSRLQSGRLSPIEALRYEIGISEDTAILAPARPRRLRAAAMLLGLAYHAALSFAAGFPWLVQDVSQSRGLYLFQAASHGFRMPLFFLISGFFTAMMWRKRGLKALLNSGSSAILLPCLLGLVTVVPATMWLSAKAVQSDGQRQVHRPPQAEGPDLWSTVTQGDADTVSRILAEGADPNARHPQFGYTPLTAAALLGHTRDRHRDPRRGENVNGRNSDGGTALHAAAFLGRADTAELLIVRGADGPPKIVAAKPPCTPPGSTGQRPVDRGLPQDRIDAAASGSGREQILGRLQEWGGPRGQNGRIAFADATRENGIRTVASVGLRADGDTGFCASVVSLVSLLAGGGFHPLCPDREVDRVEGAAQPVAAVTRRTRLADPRHVDPPRAHGRLECRIRT